MRTRLAMLAVVLGFAGSALAQDLNTEQIIKYYRKKNNVPPIQQVTVSGVKDSPIKGAKEGVLDVGTPPQVKKVPFTASADGKYVLFAETSDITVDPSKAVMAKIKLDGAACRGPKDAKMKIVEWSDEDQCFVGSCPGLFYGGCHGDDERAVFAELCEIGGRGGGERKNVAYRSALAQHDQCSRISDGERAEEYRVG